MGRKLILLALALVIPGGLFALLLAWIGSRVDVRNMLRMSCPTLYRLVTRAPAPVLLAAPTP